MIDPICKLYGIRDPTPRLEPQETKIIPDLPEDHPCHGCGILEWHTGVPYCFLPNCLRHEFEETAKGRKQS